MEFYGGETVLMLFILVCQERIIRTVFGLTLREKLIIMNNIQKELVIFENILKQIKLLEILITI